MQLHKIPSSKKGKNIQADRSYSSVLISVKNADNGDQMPFQCDLHFNLWKCRRDNYMFDCGVMLYDINYEGQAHETHTFKSIVLYLPYKCEKSEITDLGKLLNDNSESVTIVFNEFYKQSSGPDKSSIKFYENNGVDLKSFYLYALGENDIKPLNIDGCKGSFFELNISIPEELKAEKFNLYIRFRISITSEEGIAFLKHDEHIANNVLQAAFSRMELYDCRFNDIRDTDEKIYQQLTDKERLDCSLVKMRKVHFFFMTDAKDHISNGNMARMDTRMLEIDKWKKYIGDEVGHAYVAYHWKKSAESDPKKENLSSFEVFFRDTCDNANIILIFSYIALALALGMSGSLLSTIDFSKTINCTGIFANFVIYLLSFLLYCFDKCKLLK